MVKIYVNCKAIVGMNKFKVLKGAVNCKKIKVEKDSKE